MKSVVLSVAKKELLESFRDRQMILYGVVLPLAMYPVMFWVMIQGSLIVRGLSENTVVDVELVQDEATALPAILTRELSTEVEGAEASIARIDVRPVEVGDERSAAERFQDVESPPDALLFSGSGDPSLKILYDSTEGHSSLALGRLEERIPELARELRATAAQSVGVAPESLYPLELEIHNVAPEESMGSYMLSFILPMMLVIMTVMGAFFPAVDLTAGEKERGTSETTLILPIPKSQVHLGKILAVSATACLAAALNLSAMGLSAGHVLSMLASGKEFRIDLPLEAFFSVAPLAILFALFVSTVLTSIASLTKTFKEGQALLGPVQILFFLPAVACTIPGIELTPSLACVPVVNVVLAFKSLLRGEFLPLELALCALSLLALSAASSWLALRLLSRESIQLSTKSQSIGRLLSLLRSEPASR